MSAPKTRRFRMCPRVSAPRPVSSEVTKNIMSAHVRVCVSEASVVLSVSARVRARCARAVAWFRLCPRRLAPLASSLLDLAMGRILARLLALALSLALSFLCAATVFSQKQCPPPAHKSLTGTS